MVEEKELLRPKYDVVFQALFQNNRENITESLISDIYKLELRIIEIPKANRILEKEKDNRIARWVSFIDNPNTERIEEGKKKMKNLKNKKGITLVALVITTIFSYDEKLKFSNSKGFLLQTI